MKGTLRIRTYLKGSVVSSKLLTAAVLIAALSPLSIPSVQAQGLTREQVKAELAELRGLGYRSTGEDPHYPKHLQEIMAKLHEKRMQERTKAGEQVLPAQNSADNREAAAPAADRAADQDKCVGPISFCNPHFGS
ncbi:DUF4148 domain-containing protein [Burkholderia cepacia]|uniref:DUF4148 domain-containing protein n=1 Tax=Burkholderia cepacia TaxID=292 RepID=A0A2S8J4W0_BURCE|nr:DUF4148 domain-containing protein [Burkholderia cepacia]PQP22110.1 DUF4148 domain-containing protein [Burkholderia cepacia]HDR9504989.1 DUF4148 domain-containing protein [Burkholderia cepacia]